MTNARSPFAVDVSSDSSFRALKWHIEWWILPEGRSLPDIGGRGDLLVRKALPIASPPISWSFFQWPEATELDSFGLSSSFREELKSCLRRRSHIRGNVKCPFFRHGIGTVPFEVFVIPRDDRSFALFVRTPQMSLPVSSADLVAISAHPSLLSSQLRMAVEKICAALRDGDINARVATSVNYRWYPYIHIVDYSPCSNVATPADDVPWHELVAIGTRHKQIAVTDRPLIEAYKAKNHSLRGEVLVIDKQSTVVVSPKEYLELGGVRHCLAVALRMRMLLEGQFRGSTESRPLDNKLLDLLELGIEHPSVITDSQNYRTLWPRIARECQVVEWMTNVRRAASLGTIVYPTPSPTLTAISNVTDISTSGIAEPTPAKSVEWLHLSDLHFRADRNAQQSRDRVLKELCSDLEGCLGKGWRPDFIAVTGDIAFSGAADEYQLAWNYLKQIMKICELPKSALFVVPGNHDVLRSEHKAVLLTALREARTQEDYLNTCQQLASPEIQNLLNRRLSSYWKFAKGLPIRRRTSAEKLWFVDKIRGKGGATVAVAGLTSSWAAGEDGEDSKRYLAVGDFQMRPALESLRNMEADIRVVMLHHPLDSLHLRDEHALRNELCNTCDVILRGHLHNTDITSTTNPDWQHVTLAAGSAYETVWTMNGYLLARATVASSRIDFNVCARRWSPQGEFFGADTTTYKTGRDNGSFSLTVQR